MFPAPDPADQKTADKEDQQRKTDLHTEGDQIGNMFIPEGDPAVGLCHYLLRDFRGDLRRVQIGRRGDGYCQPG